MHDIKGKLKISAIWLLSVLAVTCLMITLFTGSTLLKQFFGPLLALFVLAVSFGLSFVPHLKERMWLLIPISVIISVASALILRLL